MQIVCIFMLLVAMFGIGTVVIGTIGGILLNVFLVVLGMGIKYPKKYAIYTCSFFSFIGLSLYLLKHPNLIHLWFLKVQNSVFLTYLSLAVTLVIFLVAIYSTLKLTKGIMRGDF